MRTRGRLPRGAMCVSIALSLFVVCYAQAQRLHVDSYNVEDGLPSSAIFDISQDSLGRLWVASRGGVVVFDGLDWSSVDLAGNNSVSHFDSAMAIGPDGDTWLILNDQSLSLYRFSGVHPSGRKVLGPLGEVEVSGLSLAVAGSSEDPFVAVGTDGSGLLVHAGGKWRRLNAPEDLPSNHINDLIADDDRIVVATDRGLCLLDTSGLTCLDPQDSGAPSSRVSSLARATQGRTNPSVGPIVLAGRTWLGLLENDEIHQDSLISEDGQELLLRATAMDVGPTGSVFVGTPQKVYRVDLNSGEAEGLGPADGLMVNGATAIFTDREGNVWIGTMRGLSKIVSDRFGSFTAEHGLLEDEVTAVAEMRRGSLVFGHNTGLTFLENGQFRRLSFVDEAFAGTDPFRVMDLDVDRNGDLWVAASGIGLGKQDSSGQWTWFSEGEVFEATVFSVLCVGDEVFVGTQEGLFHTTSGGITFEPIVLGEDAEVIRRLYLGPDGTLFVATARNGIFSRNDGKWTRAHHRHGRAANLVTAVYADPVGQVLVGTNAGVVGLVDGQLSDLKEPWSTIKRPIYFIVADEAGTIWLGTDHGVRAWDGHRMWAFDAHHGLAGDETNRGAGVVDSDGRLWVGTDRGVSFREPGPLAGNLVPPIALILGVETADGELHPMLEPITLPNSEKTLVFHFRGISLIDERKQSVRARLVGFDESWIGPNEVTAAGLRYTHIPPGRYVLEIQAENVHGVWSDVVSSAPLTISGPFWRSTWFLAIVLGLLGLIAAAVSRHLRQKYQMAFVDRLTGLPNRAGVLIQIGREVRKLGDEKGQLAVLLLDLDRFKHINNSLGHRAGDEVLIETGRRLENVLPAGTTLARLGGDEFVVLLAGDLSSDRAAAVAEGLQETLSLPFETEGLEAYLGASVGIRMCAGRWANSHHLLRDANVAMHQAKEKGLSRIVVFNSSMHSDNLQSLTLESELQKAAGRGLLTLHYQPLFHLVSGTLIGFEALVRWQHPSRGLLRPDSFLSIAEASGLIVEIGGWVIKQSCEQLAAWRERFEGAEDLVISVNLASQQVADPRLVRTIATALETTGLPPSSLKLELTENSIMGSDRSVTSRLEHLRHRDLGVWVDDFGTGYSSLSYLQKLPIDALKIDRSFVSELNGESGTSGIIEAILFLAENLNLTVIAEGIETEQQLERLKELGCKLGQGYFLGRPLPVREIEEKFFAERALPGAFPPKN